MIEEIEKKKIYYSNGKLRAELSFKKGIPHGIYREWYENGFLATERNFKDGIPDGISRYWDESGNLLFENNIINGTGVERSWEPVNRTWSEENWINGMCTGRVRVCWEDGSVVKDEYWIKNRKVSKKKYIEMCEFDPSLPRYDDIFGNKKTTKKSTDDNKSSLLPNNDFYDKLFSEHQMVDALKWVTEPDVPERTIGQCSRPEDSIELVKDLYVLGAVNVWTFDIDGGSNEEQNSGKLVIELPVDSQKRQQILEKCGELGKELGFDPEADTDQKYTLVILD